MTFKLTQRMRDVGNAPYEAAVNARLAAEIRAFRPESVSNLTDKQLVWVIARSRKAARDPATVRQWVYVEALLTRGFFALPEAVAHFRDTYGDPDTKARDLIQMIKATLRSNGRAAEIWW